MTTPGLPSFETERLILRPLAESDAAALHLCLGDPEAMRFWDSPAEPSVAGTTARLRRSLKASRIRHAVWALVLRNGGEVIGMVNYHRREPAHRKLEIGYILAPSHWGHGLMVEAVGVFLAHCFGKLGTHRIEALIEPSNHASIRVVERLGFTPEIGLMRDRLLVAGEFRSLALFALLAPDWSSAQARPAARARKRLR